ncbi:hypothetical protein ANO11243_077310 [Dothideomycetidae sp. 11243]|nr:hypothetical protein ANO11243_077310 [fungal sp. No.11243]
MVTSLSGQQQLVPIRAPSISSHSSIATRRHRQPRSNSGSYAESSGIQNEFPNFSLTGDVDILLTTSDGRIEQRYLLHRLILSQGSGFFEHDLRDRDLSTANPTAGFVQQAQPLRQHRASIQDSSFRSPTPGLVSLRTSVAHRQTSWSYVLDWSHTEKYSVPLLVQRSPSFSTDLAPPPVSKNKPPPSSSRFFRTLADFSALQVSGPPTNLAPNVDQDTLRDYDNFFRVLYNFSPVLNANDITDAYTECKSLLHLAELYDALEIIGPRIDHHLLRFGHHLLTRIAKYPSSYLKLGYLAQSRVIFAEALIHVVGQWPSAQPHLVRQIDLSVLELIKDKVAVLNALKATAEIKLFHMNLTTSGGDPVAPSSSFLNWLAISLFRQWLTENIPSAIHGRSSQSLEITVPTSNRSKTHASSVGTRQTTFKQLSSRLPIRTDTTGSPSSSPKHSDRAYCLLGSPSASAYLTRDDLKQFLKYAPDGMYTRDNLHRLERTFDEIKAMARGIVKPLMKNELKLDLRDSRLLVSPRRSLHRGDAAEDTGGAFDGLGYLTCTKVTERDLPWERA